MRSVMRPQASNYHCMCACSATQSCQIVTPRTVAHQAPLSMGFSRQEHWSGLPFPTPGDLPSPGVESASLALASRFFTTVLSGKTLITTEWYLKHLRPQELFVEALITLLWERARLVYLLMVHRNLQQIFTLRREIHSNQELLWAKWAR